MIAKINQVLDTIKKAFLWVVAPLAFIFGYIYYLLSKNESLTKEIEQSKIEKDLAETVAKKAEVDHEASSSVIDYNDVKRRYLESIRNGNDEPPKAS